MNQENKNNNYVWLLEHSIAYEEIQTLSAHECETSALAALCEFIEDHWPNDNLTTYSHVHLESGMSVTSFYRGEVRLLVYSVPLLP